MDQRSTHYRTCHLCEAMCGIVIETEGDNILSIKGDQQDPFSRGHICPKATALEDLHNDPDRIRQPIKKVDNTWQPISWEEAFDTIESKIKASRKQYGNNSVGFYAGNPTVHNFGAMLFLFPFLQRLKTRNKFSATSVDQLPHMLAGLELYGHNLLMPVPDIDHTQFFLCIGGNPLASNGSIMSSPDIKKRLQAIKKRGGDIVVIDPRRTETADIATQHHFIKPGKDALLLLAMIHTLFAKKKIQLGHLKAFTEQLEDLEHLTQPFAASKIGPLIDWQAEDIEQLALKFSSASSAVAYGRVGACTQEFGGLTIWLINVLNIITGNLDRRGGSMFTRPAVDFVGISYLAGSYGHFDAYRSPVRQLPEFSGEYPVVAMAEEMLTPHDSQIKTFITYAGNPVLSTPNGTQLEKALDGLDFMVSIDYYINETTCHADIILPPASPLERPHYDIVFHLFAIRNTAKYSPALFPMAKDSKQDWEIFLELMMRLGKSDWPSKTRDQLTKKLIQSMQGEGILNLLLKNGPYGSRWTPIAWLDELLATSSFTDRSYQLAKSRVTRQLKQFPLMDLLLNMTPYGEHHNPSRHQLSKQRLLDSPHGIDFGPLEPCLPQRLFTKSKTIPLVPDIYREDMRRIHGLLANEVSSICAPTFDLELIGRRHVRSNNTWMHNSYRLVKGKSRCTLLINPVDAKLRQIKTGDLVSIESRVGKVISTVEVSDTMAPGVVSLPHGWGHSREGSQLSIASNHPGASINDLTDDHLLDKLTGTAILNGTPVSVSKVKTSAGTKRSTTKTVKKKAVAKKKATVNKRQKAGMQNNPPA